MDNFMDKLVEKINAQGQIRPQNLVNNSNNDELIKEFATKVQQNNEKVVELASQYKESIEESIHKENVRCYRNTQAMVEENIGKLPNQITDEIKANLDQLSEKISSDIKESIIASEESLTSKTDAKIKGLKSMVAAALTFAILDFAALVVILLWIFRII